MNPWMIFLTGTLLLTLLFGGGIYISRRKHQSDSHIRAAAQDANLLILTIWLALLSILAYIAFVFGKR